MAAEGREGTALQEKAAIVHSPEMMEGDPSEAWMCSDSVVQGEREFVKATKVVLHPLKVESLMWAEML